MGHAGRAAGFVAIVLMAASATAGERQPDRAGRPADNAFAFFAGYDDASWPAFLDRVRPEPLSPPSRAQVMAELPREGELSPTPAERAKLGAIEPILAFHRRRDAVAVKVIDVGHAFVGLHARTVLLLSRDALALVTPRELQALAAHELGHEYVWNEYQAAMAAADVARMQELELVCDGIAVITLRELALDPAWLVTAVTKMTRHNERLGATATVARYATLGERRRFIQRLAAPSFRRPTGGR